MVTKATEPVAIVTPAGKVAETVASPPQAQGMWAALRIRDYRFLWLGMIISSHGMWMQMVAQGYLVYELTRSPAALGLVGLARAIPVLVLSLFAGVAADRMDRRKLLIVTQSLAGVFSLILAVLTSTGQIQVWMILALGFLNASVMSFDNPTRQALIPDLVGREYMANAIALNSTAFSASQVLGPAIAGVLLAATSPAICFYANAVSYIAIIAALIAMRPVKTQGRRSTGGMLHNLIAGFGYVRKNAVVAAFLVQIGVLCLLSRSSSQLLPAVQRDVLHVGAGGLGGLNAATGLGALIAALAVAKLSNFQHRGWLVIGAYTAGAVALIAFAFSRSFPLSCVLLAVIGGGGVMTMSTSNMLVQSRIPDELRGRVMGIWTMLIMGGMPLGAMLLGTVASFVGITTTFALAGVICLLCLLVINLRVPAVREQA